MQDVPGPFVPEDYHHLDDIDPDSRNVALDEERRIEAEGEFYDGDKDQDGEDVDDAGRGSWKYP